MLCPAEDKHKRPLHCLRRLESCHQCDGHRVNARAGRRKRFPTVYRHQYVHQSIRTSIDGCRDACPGGRYQYGPNGGPSLGYWPGSGASHGVESRPRRTDASGASLSQNRYESTTRYEPWPALLKMRVEGVEQVVAPVWHKVRGRCRRVNINTLFCFLLRASSSPIPMLPSSSSPPVEAIPIASSRHH